MSHLKKFSSTKKHSTLMRYFLSYFLIVCLLLAGFFLLVQRQITEIYFDDLIGQTQKRLENTGQQFRNEIASINQIHNSLINNIDLIEFRFSNDNWKQYQAEKKLKEYTVANSFLDSIVYLDKKSGNLLSSDKYVEYQDGIFKIYDTDASLHFRPEDYDLTTEQPIFLSNDSFQSMVYCPDSETNDRYFIFYILNTTEIQQMLKDTVTNGITSIALLDGNGKITLEKNAQTLEHAFTPPSKNLTPGIQVVDDDTILAITNHVYGEYSLAALISNSYLKEQVHDTFRSTYLLCLLLAGVGFLLIFLSLRSTYLPLHRLVHKVIRHPDSKENYLRLLEESFASTRTENQQLQLKIEKYRLSMQRSVLDALVSGNQPPLSENTPDLEAFFSTDSGNRIFAVCLQSTQETFPLAKALRDLKNLLPKNSTCVVLHQQENQAIFLLNMKGDKQDTATALMDLLETLNQTRGYQASFSNSSSSPLDIPSLYENAVFAGKHQNGTPVISYSDLNRKKVHSPDLSYPYEQLDELEQGLEDTDFEKIRANLKRLFQQIDHSAEQEGSLPDFYLRCILIDILTLLGNALNQSNINFKSYQNLYFETLFYCRSCSYEEKRTEIHENTEKLVILLEQEIENAAIPGNQIRETVEANYTSPDFSITALADEFHVSVSYMSYLFKKELNQNFSDFLWNLRLEKAKELLLTTDLPIDVVSLSVGYLNASSFRRKFKQAIGVSPSQFRSDRKL